MAWFEHKNAPQYPKPAMASKLIMKEKPKFSLSIAESNRIAGMRILVAEGEPRLFNVLYILF